MEEEQNREQPQEVMDDLVKPKAPLFTPRLIIVLVVVLLLGIGSGYLLSRKSGSLNLSNLGGSTKTSVSSTNRGTIVGSSDTKTFRDTAEGVLKKGGIDGEGAYHLVRTGGDSQNVYLTSSIVDLSLFVDKKIKVWGETNEAQHAGWLMDVGRVEVLQ